MCSHKKPITHVAVQPFEFEYAKICWVWSTTLEMKRTFFSCCLWRGLSLGCLKNTTKAQHKPHAQSNQTHSALNCVLTNRTGFALIWLQSDFARHFQTFFFFISFFLAPNPSSPPHILPTNLNYTPTLVGNKSDSNYYTTHQSEIENERHYQHWRRGDGWYWNEIKPHRRLLRLWLED